LILFCEQTQTARLRPAFFPTAAFDASLLGAASSLSVSTWSATFLAVANYWVLPTGVPRL